MPVRELLPSEVGSHVSCIRAGVDGGAVSAMRALTRNIEELETALLSPALHDCELIKESFCSLSPRHPRQRGHRGAGGASLRC